MNIAFWNVPGATRADHVASLVLEHHVDVLVAAEADRLDADTVADHLAPLGPFESPGPFRGKGRKLLVLTRRELGARMVLEEQRQVAFRVTKGGLDLLCVGLHLESGLWRRPGDAEAGLRRAAATIAKLEEEQGLDRTVVIGDFNVDPYFHGMADFESFHAVMDRRIAARGTRTFKGAKRRFFYNPMWSLLGDVDERSAGSYFDRGASSHVAPMYWHTFDQALVRPALLRHLPERPVRLVSTLGGRQCVDEDRRPLKAFSDHLPLLLTLDERRAA